MKQQEWEFTARPGTPQPVREALEAAPAPPEPAPPVAAPAPVAEDAPAPATYYERLAVPHVDGSPIFKSQEDERSENEIAVLVETAWSCTLGSFGRLSAIDWYATRQGRLVGLVELKTRSHASDKYPTVFLNVRKWLALTLASQGLNVPASFVVRFTDCVKHIPLSEIDARRVKMGGLKSIVKSRNDVEPIIEVDVSAMRMLDDKPKGSP